LRRFTEHILPRHFQRVRYAGLFTAARRRERLAVCREKLADYYRSRGIRIPRGLASQAEPVQLETHYDCGHCRGKMTTTAEVSGKVMMRILSLTALATTRFLSGITGTMTDLCQHLKTDNRKLNADACRRKPYVYLGDKEYRFAELVILQHIQAIEEALALAAMLEVEANAQPPPPEPSEGPLRCKVRHLEALT
jgi:hypothetical protein